MFSLCLIFREIITRFFVSINRQLRDLIDRLKQLVESLCIYFSRNFSILERLTENRVDCFIDE